VAAAALASSLLAFGAHVAAERIPVQERVRRGFDFALAVLAVGAVVVGLVAVGGPREGFETLERRFDSATVTTADLNDRLFSIAGNGRSDQLRVSWDAAREARVAGNGAGTFEYLWYERRPTLLVVRDGHSLYLETLAEVGVVGLTLLGGALLVLVVGGIRARRSRYVAAATGAFLAWAAASAFDWHWEMVGVTLTALLAGSAGLVASERRAPRPMTEGSRFVLIGVTTALSILGVVSLVGNQALFAGREALAREEWQEARHDARRADALLPWSFEPELVLGDAAAGLGDREAALDAYRDAVAEDPENWVAWLRLGQVARGSERATAYQRVRRLNPLEEGLPGE
jgi:hypothetical protein